MLNKSKISFFFLGSHLHRPEWWGAVVAICFVGVMILLGWHGVAIIHGFHRAGG